MLGLFIYLWPIVVAAMITVSILGVPGFNGFIAVSLNFQPEGKKGAGVLGIIISLIYLGLAALGSYLYYRIFKERSILTKLLL
jgi:formate hydrogenlyase subunit 3/multisubunit Na+/H+ antiporter MnhD subunit